MKILNFGSINIDNVYQVEHFVRPGETVSSLSMKKHSGGKGLNQSIALARAGGQVYHAGAVGPDGGFLKEALENAGVNTEYLFIREDVPTGHAIIQVDTQGQNCILLDGGANQTFTEKEISKVLSNFQKGDLLILQNEINQMPFIIQEAHKIGMKIVLNPSPMDEKISSFPLEYIDYFILNEIEAQGLTNIDNDNYIDNCLKTFPDAAFILTLGEQGAWYADNNTRVHHGIYKVKSVDTTAAGDTFTGFFFSSLSQGKSIEESLERASKASAIAVSRPGAEPSIPTNKEVEDSQLSLA